MALLLGVLISVCSGSLWLADLGGDPTAGDPRPIREVLAAPPPVRAVERPPETPEPAPREKVVARLVRQLSETRPCRREAAIVELGKLGADARAALPGLRNLVDGAPGRLRYLAMAAAMRVEGGRRHYRTLAEAAAGDREARFAFLRFDPGGGTAILEALRLRRPSPPLGLEAFLAEYHRDEVPGIAELGRRIRASDHARELHDWLAVVGGFRPAPPALASDLGHVLRNGPPHLPVVVAFSLSHPPLNSSRLRDALLPAVRAAARDAAPALKVALIEALGQPGTKDAGTLRLIVESLAGPTVVATAAAAALERLGRDARPAIPGMLAAARNRRPGTRLDLLTALAATKDRRVLPLLRNVLADDESGEWWTLLQRLRPFDGAEVLVAEFPARYEQVPLRVRSRLVRKAMELDPWLLTPATSDIIGRALAERRMEIAEDTVLGAWKLQGLTAPVAAALARALDHIDPTAASRPLRHLLERFPDATGHSRILQPTLRRLAEAPELRRAAGAVLAGLR